MVSILFSFFSFFFLPCFYYHFPLFFLLFECFISGFSLSSYSKMKEIYLTALCRMPFLQSIQKASSENIPNISKINKYNWIFRLILIRTAAWEIDMNNSGIYRNVWKFSSCFCFIWGGHWIRLSKMGLEFKDVPRICIDLSRATAPTDSIFEPTNALIKDEAISIMESFK